MIKVNPKKTIKDTFQKKFLVDLIDELMRTGIRTPEKLDEKFPLERIIEFNIAYSQFIIEGEESFVHYLNNYFIPNILLPENHPPDELMYRIRHKGYCTNPQCENIMKSKPIEKELDSPGYLTEQEILTGYVKENPDSLYTLDCDECQRPAKWVFSTNIIRPPFSLSDDKHKHKIYLFESNIKLGELSDSGVIMMLLLKYTGFKSEKFNPRAKFTDLYRVRLALCPMSKQELLITVYDIKQTIQSFDIPHGRDYAKKSGCIRNIKSEHVGSVVSHFTKFGDLSKKPEYMAWHVDDRFANPETKTVAPIEIQISDLDTYNVNQFSPNLISEKYVQERLRAAQNYWEKKGMLTRILQFQDWLEKNRVFSRVAYFQRRHEEQY